MDEKLEGEKLKAYLEEMGITEKQHKTNLLSYLNNQTNLSHIDEICWVNSSR